MIEYINGTLLIKNKFIKQNFAIENGILFLTYSKKPIKTIDLVGKYVSPGFFDIHVHTRVPGSEYKDDLKHIQESAMAGGITQFIAMANTTPQPINTNIFNDIQKLMNTSFLKIYQAARVTHNNSIINFQEMSKLTHFYSDDGEPIAKESIMKEALLNAKKYESILFLHENDVEIHGDAYESSFTKKYQIKSFDYKYETNILKRDIELNRKINAKIHIQHISTKEGLELFRDAKASGMNISAEITPHHLCINNSEIADDDANYKMNPPLGSKKDQAALIKAFKEGIIDIIASDHAPHSTLDKSKGFKASPFGVINLESAFASVYTQLGEKYLLEILKAYSVNPAKLVNINIEIQNNKKANIIIIDPKLVWTFKKENIKSKSSNSPFINKKFKGKIIHTIYGIHERKMID